MCDNCGNINITKTCLLCNAYQFCSAVCSDAMASRHFAVCYDAHSEDAGYLNALIEANGIVAPAARLIGDMHMAIETHLESNDFTEAALELIERRGRTTKRKQRAPRKTARRKKRGSSTKSQSMNMPSNQPGQAGPYTRIKPGPDSMYDEGY